MLKNLFLSLIICFITYSGCSKSKQFYSIENPSGDNTSLPKLYTDNTGTVFMSWVEQIDTIAILYYSKFENNLWSEPFKVQKSDQWFVNWADYPSIIAYAGKPMAVHWLKKTPGNTYSYNVEVATFNEKGLNSSIVPHDDGTATEHGFVSMIPVSDTSFYAVWLDGRNTIRGHGEHGDLSSAMTLRGASLSISGDIISEDELDVDVCDCCNTSIAKTSNGIITAYRNRTENENRDIYIKKMSNGVWEDEKHVFHDKWEIAACPVNGPAIDVYNETVSVAWFTGANNQATVKLSFSLDEGDSFLPPVIIDSVSPLGRVDLIANDEKSSWVSWVSRTEEGAELNLQLISIDGDILESHIISKMNPSRGSGFPQITKYKKSIIAAWTDYTEYSKSIETAILR